MSNAAGWAVVNGKGEIRVETVSPSRLAAVVNWLVVSGRVMVSADASDRWIEASWDALKGDNTIALVKISTEDV